MERTSLPIRSKFQACAVDLGETRLQGPWLQAQPRRFAWGRIFGAIFCLAWLGLPTVALAQPTLVVDPITGDNKIRIQEKVTGFSITGNTGTAGG